MNTLELAINAAIPIKALHEEVRQIFEAKLEQEYRVTAIKDTCTSLYDATLETRENAQPEYILSHVLVEFDIVAVKNGPIVNMFNRETFYFKAYLLSTGVLGVTLMRMDVK